MKQSAEASQASISGFQETGVPLFNVSSYVHFQMGKLFSTLAGIKRPFDRDLHESSAFVARPGANTMNVLRFLAFLRKNEFHSIGHRALIPFNGRALYGLF